MKYTFVVILKDGEENFEKVKKLSASLPTVMVSGRGWIALIGDFKEEDIKDYEHYSAAIDWQTEAGWMDLPL